VTNIEIQEFAIEHFPEGPAAAIEPQRAWLAYNQSMAAEKAALPFKKQFFLQSRQPMPEATKQWGAFVADWCRRVFRFMAFAAAIAGSCGFRERNQSDASAPTGAGAGFVAGAAGRSGEGTLSGPFPRKNGQIARTIV
jgi:hypothetical protein